MSSKQELEITITSTGDVSINVHGAKGATCLELTKDIEEALGLVVDREKKSSFYETDESSKVRLNGEI